MLWRCKKIWIGRNYQKGVTLWLITNEKGEITRIYIFIAVSINDTLLKKYANFVVSIRIDVLAKENMPFLFVV